MTCGPRGFSLVEVIISLVIFAAVILGLTGLAYQVARNTTRSTDQALVMSVLLSRVDRASAVPFDSLAVIAVCDTTISGSAKVFACTTLQMSPGARVAALTVVVRTSVPGSRPDTVVIQRSKHPIPIPLR